ncbi:MAG TPA: hypothetical protein VG015_05700 [Candidatus Dormibacteraeota bacterium]|jgi:uncharacterized membrane protein|nr:hypothetical protein [Candidatus Dormibacteraeota bacterium]
MRDLLDLPKVAWIDAIALLGTMLLTFEVVVDGPAQTRLPLALLFVTFVPGWSLLAPSGPKDLLARTALSIGLSLSICGLLATILVWARIWHPQVLFGAIAAVSIVLLAIGIVRQVLPPPVKGPA